MKQNIGWLQIPMNNSKFDHFFDSFQYLSYYIYGFGFPLSFIYCLHFQIGLAILHDQINAVILINHLVKLDNVRVVSIFEDVNLVFKCSFEVRDKILVSLFGIGNFYLLDGIGKAAIDFSE